MSPVLRFRASSPRRGFSLVELLTVLAIVGLLAAIVLPGLLSIQRARALSVASSDIASLLEQARTHAMANNTYVYVGLFEADATRTDTGTRVSGIGRIYVQVAASRDGTNGYQNGDWDSSNLAAVGPLRSFDGVHLVRDGAVIHAALGSMDASDGSNIDLSSPPTTPFAGPVGSAQRVCIFDSVIQFSPAGAASVVTSLSGVAAVRPYIQFGLEPARGNQAATVLANCAGFQIDGITGSIQVFRPSK
ncbi:prepilin-type N-terminal cleavage/methylation domain-containing protein [Verrucomicrobium sp. GAS474]|uniref:prepilin-type N-terminal cleavage/methylation domain-containing protein n=1 Tax=Verrucomicrobium sp. GAS474 TaxID=1882831 RepID=UPI00087AE21A|nr:prepilin-type N-terminal cleavage/methylation domain-containing protein [Verrucomicrobium sp. GAS474]SDU02698.1 prepilin-type N-terminal cleavage/methylation domain-containing protein [Verrucomicrobium sp. GAS474]